VNALRNIHGALVANGTLIDTQPISARPPVAAAGIEVGSLDMREWLETIDAVDKLLAETIHAGLFKLQDEERFIVTDTFDDASEFLETVSGWRGTRVPSALASRVMEPPITVRQEVRLRLFRGGRE
jgi:hypothetical protein